MPKRESLNRSETGAERRRIFFMGDGDFCSTRASGENEGHDTKNGKNTPFYFCFHLAVPPLFYGAPPMTIFLKFFRILRSKVSGVKQNEVLQRFQLWRYAPLFCPYLFHRMRVYSIKPFFIIVSGFLNNAMPVFIFRKLSLE